MPKIRVINVTSLSLFMNVSGTRLRLYPDIAMSGDAAIAKGMAGSRKYFGIFELPQACGGKRFKTIPLGIVF